MLRDKQRETQTMQMERAGTKEVLSSHRKNLESLYKGVYKRRVSKGEGKVEPFNAQRTPYPL